MVPCCPIAMQEIFQSSNYCIAKSPEGRCGEERGRFGQNLEEWIRFPAVERSSNICQYEQKQRRRNN